MKRCFATLAAQNGLTPRDAMALSLVARHAHRSDDPIIQKVVDGLAGDAASVAKSLLGRPVDREPEHVAKLAEYLRARNENLIHHESNQRKRSSGDNMKLKPCKITKLDDTFWRVDWEGCTAIIRYRGPASYWFNGDTMGNSVEDVLRKVGLTAEQPEPETAEDRIRAMIARGHNTGGYALLWSDIQTLLAKLDRLREENDDTERQLKAALSAKDTAQMDWDSLAATLQTREAELYRLRADLAQMVCDLDDALVKVDKIARGAKVRGCDQNDNLP